MLLLNQVVDKTMVVAMKENKNELASGFSRVKTTACK
jgi:hypothetical protein